MKKFQDDNFTRLWKISRKAPVRREWYLETMIWFAAAAVFVAVKAIFS